MCNNQCLLFSPYNANPSELTASIQNERKSWGWGGDASLHLCLWEVRGQEGGAGEGQVRTQRGFSVSPPPCWGCLTAERVVRFLTAWEGKRLSLWKGKWVRRATASPSSDGWHRSTKEQRPLLQTGPWEILWGLRPLSAPSSPQFDHLLTLQGSEPSQPLSSESLAFFPFIPSTNIYQ